MTKKPAGTLEAAADAILRLDRSAEGSWSDILLEDQLALRAFREISMDPYVFDVGLTPGIYRREYSPLRPRPRIPPDPYGKLEFDARVGMALPHSGWAEDLMPFTDPEWPMPGPHHLDRYQRCRIRRELRKVPQGNTRLRHLTRHLLAIKYGVQIRVILELERKT